MEGSVGLFTPDRLGFNLAWLGAIYLTFQLLSIPFALPTGGNPIRRRGRRHGLAGAARGRAGGGVRQARAASARRSAWEAAFLLIFMTMVDLFGGYMFNIALSRRTMDVGLVPRGVNLRAPMRAAPFESQRTDST